MLDLKEVNKKVGYFTITGFIRNKLLKLKRIKINTIIVKINRGILFILLYKAITWFTILYLISPYI